MELSAPRLIRRIEGSSRIGSRVWHTPSVGSTNAALRELADGGCAGHGAVLWAGEQTAGRGRLGRKWVSPRGAGLFVSVLVAGAENRILYSMASLAIRGAISSIHHIPCALKWPNDVLVGGKKVAGILIEQRSDDAILGIGINTGMTRPELDRISPEATSLLVATGRGGDHAVLLDRLLDHLEEQYIRSSRSSDLVFQEWKSALVTLGHSVEVQTARETWRGVAVDVALDGSLLVLNDKRLVRVYAADVRIRTR